MYAGVCTIDADGMLRFPVGLATCDVLAVAGVLLLVVLRLFALLVLVSVVLVVDLRLVVFDAEGGIDRGREEVRI